MKFVCSNCKAKYQIADEKIQGRTLKMECRRCNTPITIRGDLPQQADEVEMEADVPSARGASRRPPAASSSMSSASSRARASSTASMAGHAAPSSLGADFRRGSLAPEARPEARTSVLDQWHVAISDVPVGPMRREEVSRKIATGAVTAESLAWREGFDDWRPVRDIPELAALLRKAEPLPGRAMPAPRAGAGARLAASSPSRLGGQRAAAAAPTSSAAARAGNVVPIGGRHGGAAPAIAPDDDFADLDGDEQDEATQIASAADLGLLALTSKPEPARVPEKPRKDPTGPARAPMPRPHAPAPKVESKREPSRPIAVEPVLPPEPADDGLPALLEAQPSATPFVAAPAAVTAPAPLPIPSAERVPEKRRRGLPPFAWIGIAGAVAFGGVFAFMAAQRLLPPAAPVAAAVVVPVATPETPPAPVEAPIDLEAATEETPPETGETAVATEETPASPTTGTTGTTPRATTGRATGAGGSGAGVGSGGAPNAALSESLARLAEEGGGPATITGGATSRALGESATPRSAELTSEQIAGVVNRQQATLRRCWETAIRGMRETPTVRMDVAITIGTSGTVTAATARGPSVGTLSDCIERSVRTWRFPASGGTSRTSFPVVFSGTS